ncbi:MAG: hypothetical protein ABSH22_03190 [Tepidisphaeraceae bacterium]
MKRGILAAALAAVGCGIVSSASMAGVYEGTVVLNQDLNNYSSGVGGEFQANVVYAAGAPYTVATAGPNVQIGGPSTSAEAIFQTFCIQEGVNDVDFCPGSTYYASITPAPGNGAPSSVTSVTKVLYAEFYNGSLKNNGYDYTEGSGRTLSAGELQAAIWTAEGDQTSIANAASDAGISGNSAAQTQAQDWLTDAQNYVASGFTATADLEGASATGYNLVEVLGLYNTQAEAANPSSAGIDQNQLVEVCAPVPLPVTANATIVLLGAVGLFGLIRRRRMTT